MNYKVLYRKYRPDDFENIVGQNYIIKTLKNSVINQNISHAYIFSGPRGTGKTSTAKVFSKAINCLNPQDGSPCGKCEFCLNSLENPDIIEIDAASNNGVDEIRNLIDNIKLTPTNGKYKVYIIDEVHMLTTSAFNALLLTLEEPPKHAIFILATTNIENVPITILSRCQRYDFQKIKIDDIVSRLSEICNKENIEIEPEALTEIAYLSEGGMRDALSLLDQLSKGNQKITLDIVEKQIKIVSNKTLTEIFDILENNDVDKFIEILEEFRVRNVDYKTLIKRMIEIASNRAKNIKKTSRFNRLNFIDYRNIVFNLTDCLTKININVEPYTILEMELLEFFNTDNVNLNVTKISVQDKNENKNIEVNNSDVSKDNNKVVTNLSQEISKNDFEDLIKIRINNCFVNAQKKYLEQYKEIINNYVTSSIISGRIKSIMLDANLVAASDRYMIFTCENEHSMENANNLLDVIEQDISNLLSEEAKIIFVTIERWNKEKQKYIDNLKNNIKYEYIEEKNNDSMEEIIINDVFDTSKVEII